MGCEHEVYGGNGVSGLAHIGVIVKNMEKSLEFYLNTLGFECYSRAEVGENGETKLSFLRCGTCVIELIEPPQYGTRSDGAVDHIALKVSDIEAMMKRLIDTGVTFETEKPIEAAILCENGIKCVFFHGPDGERIELMQEL